MKLIKGLMVAAVAATGWGLEAATGASEADAIELKPKTAVQKTQVKLVQEGTNFVCYYKIVVSKGKAYTLWLSDFAAGSQIRIDEVYSQLFGKGFEMGPTAQFEAAQCGDTVRWVMSGKEWADESGWSGGGSGADPWGDWGDWGDDSTKTPNTWPYYVRVTGAKGETAALNYQIGNAIPQGVEQNPLVIKPKTAEQTSGTLSFLGPNYYLQLDMKAGARYHFKTSGGSAANELTVESAIGGISRHLDAAAGNDYETIIPYESGTYKIWIKSSFGLGATAGLTYRVDAERTLKQHKVTATLAANKSVTCKPGHLNAWGTGAYDAIIDECLYKFTAAKGVDYLALTTGASRNLLMRVYDSKGNVIASNDGDGIGQNVRCAIPAPTKKTDYYIGVCENLGSDDDVVKPAYLPVSLTVRSVSLADGLIPLTPAIGANEADVRAKDPTGRVAPTPLGDSCWSHVYTIAARKDISYALASSWVSDAAGQKLTAEVYTVSGKKEKTVATGELVPGSTIALVFTASNNDVHYIRVKPETGMGIVVPAYKLHSMGFAQDGGALGALKVVLKGAETATWLLNNEKTKYVSGDSMLLPAGAYTVKFSKVKGFGTPADRKLTVVAGKVTEFEQYYGDTYDPKDDQISGKSGSVTYKATSWSLKNAETEKTAQARTLWKTDPADNFEIAGKDGYLYDFHLDQEGDCDAVFSISGTDVKDATSVSQVALPASKAKKYYLTVSHRDPQNPKNTSYSLNGHFANVGAIKFSKAKMSVKDTATSVKLTVNRTAKDGMVKVHYRTVAGTAKANEQFVPDEGDLEWADKDSKAKTVEIKLIPKLLALKTGDTAFKVVLTDAHGEYPAPITVPECEITIKNSGKYATAAAAYAAANKTKQATVKTETVPLRGGTFFGVLSTGKSKTGLAALASVTLTVSAKTADDLTKDTLSAKVALAGKTYAFKPGKGEPTWDGTDEKGRLVKRLVQVQKIGKQSVSNVLEVAVVDGSNAGTGWTKAVAEVKLMMNVPDAKGSGYQAEVPYSGQAFRQNAKINDYLAKAYLFAGYYTVSLLPGEVSTTEGQKLSADGKVPSGNGYLTVTVDNKGTAKLAGLLPDNTKVSVSATACGIVADGASANGYAMEIPVFVTKSPYCCGGWIRLCAQKDSNRPDGKTSKLVVDLANTDLRWNNDNAAITYQGTTGWRMSFNAVGGWYDKVFNLQTYYNDYAAAQKFDIEAIKTTGFPKELLSGGYSYVSLDNAQIDGAPVDVAGNTTATKKKALVKSAANRKLNDLGLSTNPCNIQVKLARATGIVTGGFSLWSQSASAQKEITGFKHYGVITLDRDDGAVAVMDDDLISSGFLHKVIKIGKRNWAFSMPFNISAEPMDD